MGKVFNRRNVLVACAAIVLLTVAWFQAASTRGRLAARYDSAHGHYRLLGYGLPAAGVSEYKEILRVRYGVEYRQVALCIVSHSLVSYVDAYDEVSSTAIGHKFGHDVLKESWAEATKSWQEKHPAELQNVSRGE